MWLRILGVAGAVVGVTACGSGFDISQYPTPQALLTASISAYERGDCDGAVRGLRRVAVELPPRDAQIAEARFYLAECLLRDGERIESAREFRRVADEFPQHERAPWALLRAGDALARLWKRPELDPTYGTNAISTYSELLGRYPQSDAAVEARVKLAALQDQFALKDLKNGEFYSRLRAYDSAILYYKSIVARYPDSRYAPIALMKLVETYRRIGYEEEARETCDHLRRFFPEVEGLDERCPVPTAN